MEISETLIAESARTIHYAYATVRHCVEQLTDADIWARESDHVNSIGIMIQHLCGNLRQWIISGIGWKPDVRDRPSEFRDATRTGRDELMSGFRETIEECKETLRQLTPDPHHEGTTRGAV